MISDHDFICGLDDLIDVKLCRQDIIDLFSGVFGADDSIKAILAEQLTDKELIDAENARKISEEIDRFDKAKREAYRV